MSWSASLLIRNDVAELSRMAAWIDAWASQHDVADQTAQRVDLCAAEAVTNVMTHGARSQHAGEVALRIGRHDADIVLEIEDNGIAFDPTQAPLPPPVTMDSDRVGGWGMRIVRSLSDEVRYQRIGGRNRLTLIFHPRPSVAA
jgi:anti-sigma regulatory factor (Ser/Thr protein kinase)